MHGALVSDVSYYQTIELKGQLEALRQILAAISDAAAVPASSKRYTSGIRSAAIDLYYFDTYPIGLIGPATINWDTPSVPDATQESDPKALRQLYIRFHPSLLKAVSGAVEQSLKAFQAKAPVLTPGQQHTAEEVAFRSVGMTFRNFCAFEIMGPMASDVVKACLKPINNAADVKKKVCNMIEKPAR